MKQHKRRLDVAVCEAHPDISRTQVQSWIMQGTVRVSGKVVTKPGTLVSSDALISLEVTKPLYVGRAGYKLAKALDEFGIDVTGKIAMDAGISTGGFTDCLLQRGIGRVYGVDVAHGEVHESLRDNPRLVLYERTNLRYLEGLPEIIDLVTLDLSFISVIKVLAAVKNVLKPGGELIVLIKPQFEAKRSEIGRGGVISDPKVHARVVEAVSAAIVEAGFTLKGCVPSPILGGSGNQEFLAYFIYTGDSTPPLALK